MKLTIKARGNTLNINFDGDDIDVELEGDTIEWEADSDTINLDINSNGELFEGEPVEDWRQTLDANIATARTLDVDCPHHGCPGRPGQWCGPPGGGSSYGATFTHAARKTLAKAAP